MVNRYKVDAVRLVCASWVLVKSSSVSLNTSD